MFKKLISNLPFNPSLIGQVSFYAKRLHREEKLRRAGIILVVLSIVVQMFAVISPPEPTLAESDNDIIRGGFSNRDQAVLHCLNPESDFSRILAYYGVSCDHVAKASTVDLKSTAYSNKLDSMGRRPQGQVIKKTGKPTDEYAVDIDGAGRFYLRNLWAWDSGPYSTYKALKIDSASGPIFILYNCGNIVTVDRYVPPPPPPPVPQAQPTPAPIKVVACGSLRMSLVNNAHVKTGTKVEIRGQAVGRNLSDEDRATLIYDVIDPANGDRKGSKITVRGVEFQNGVATDEDWHYYTFNEPGTYQLRLAVTYKDGSVTKDASGNQTGDCVKQITVYEADICPDEPGSQEDSTVCLQYLKSASNPTQNLDDANNTMANPGDTIVYMLTVNNSSNQDVSNFVFKESVSDVLEYADIVDLDGGALDAKTVIWPAVTIPANQSVTKKVTVKVKNPLPRTPVSISDPSSYDLVMTNVFYDSSVNIELPSNPLKTTELVVTTLPSTGPGSSMIIAATLTMVVAYFYARSRLLTKEIELVREEYATHGGY